VNEEQFDPVRDQRIDARVECERDVIAFLRTEHLAGADTDDEAAVALEIEQARLVLVGAAGAIVFGVTQLLSVERPLCVEPLFGSFAFLLLAILVSWIALLRGAAFRVWRVERRHRMFRTERWRYLFGFRAHVAPRLGRMEAFWRRIIRIEHRKRRNLARIRYAAVLLAGAGFAGALWSVVGTTDPRMCHFTLQPPVAKAKS
jgi:hypothetical protein